MPSVLIVDDLLSIHEMLDAVIQPTGFATSFATDGEKALVRYKAEKFDLVLADIDMKPMDGITLLKHLKAYDPSAVVIIMTAYASTESAIQALKFGAFDYLQKPFRVDELIATLRRGLEYKQFQSERAGASGVPTVKAADLENRIVGSSPAVRKLHQQIRKLASVRTPVLLQGEAGTGKTTIAEILHASNAGPDAPFVGIDCTLSSEDDLRVGLIGENGAGGSWVAKARGGTLFLQNLQRLPMAMQKDLVSVIRNTAHGFRLICTSGEDLERLTDEGKFHDELFYRVASLPVVLPPLREHPEDIPPLVKHFVGKATNPLFDANLVEFSDDALAVLSAHAWPGNVVELGQTVTKVAATTDTRVVTSAQLPLRLKEISQWPSLADYLAGHEKQYVDMVLHAARGDKEAAAKVLGVDAGKLG
jgi:DNA-binding NtrC family response regulator